MSAIAQANPKSTRHRSKDGLRVRRMRLIMALCLLEVVAPILVFLRFFGISLTQLVNVNQLLIFFAIVGLTQGINLRMAKFLMLMVVMLVISLLKMYGISDVANINFTFGAVGPYFYSLVMPFLILNSIFSQKNTDISKIRDDLFFFSKWYLIVVTPLILAYAFLYFTGEISYFGFGVNFHYFAPVFFHRHTFVVGMALLVVLTGKRAVLINFIVQYGLYCIGQFRRSPVTVLVIGIAAVAVAWIASEFVSIVFRRFVLMWEAFGEADFRDGILAFASSSEARVIFSGRLEEIVGLWRYFSEHPGQIWFGSPPGAAYVASGQGEAEQLLRSYSHFTWLGYIFRFGIATTIPMILFFLFIAVRGANVRNPLWLVFVGILSSATFGGNLFYSPIAWTLIALYIRYGSNIIEVQQEKQMAISAKRPGMRSVYAR